jgi:hypothetical protein
MFDRTLVHRHWTIVALVTGVWVVPATGGTILIQQELLPVTRALEASVGELEVNVVANVLEIRFQSFDGRTDRLRSVRRAPDDASDTYTKLSVYIDGAGTAKFARVFIVGPTGGVADGSYREGGELDTGPDFRWDVTTAVGDSGWTAQMRIPLGSLGLAGAGVPRVYAEYRRVDEKSETFASADPNSHGGCLLCAAQPVDELRGVAPSAVTHQLTPGFYAITSRMNQAGERSKSSQTRASVSGIVQIGERVELRGTYQPNFAEREPDDPVLRSGSQFPVPLDERRQFFARSTDLLQTPGVALINTRTIVSPKLALAGEYRGDAWRASSVSAREEAGSFLYVPGSYSTSVAVAPVSRVLLARAVASSLAGDVGVSVTNRQFESLGSTRVAALDGTARFGDGFTTSGLLAQSSSDVCAERSIFVACPSYSGRVGHVTLGQTKALQSFKLAATDVSPGFRSDVGFLTQVGFRRYEASARQDFQKPVAGIDVIRVKPAAVVADDSNGLSLARSLALTTDVEGAGSLLSIGLTPINRIRLGPDQDSIKAASASVTLLGSPSPTWSRLGAKVTFGQLPDYANLRRGRGWQTGIESNWAWAGGISIDSTLLAYRTRAEGSTERYSYEELQTLLKANWQYATWTRLRFVVTLSSAGVVPLPTGLPNRQRSIAYSVLWEHAPRLGWSWTAGITKVHDQMTPATTMEVIGKVAYTF